MHTPSLHLYLFLPFQYDISKHFKALLLTVNVSTGGGRSIYKLNDTTCTLQWASITLNL